VAMSAQTATVPQIDPTIGPVTFDLCWVDGAAAVDDGAPVRLVACEVEDAL
jgi:hypothetical protein